MDLFESVSRTIAAHRLLTRGDAVLIALSGGPDSVALLHILTRLRPTLDLSLRAVYINHQIRKRAALQEEKFCQQLCQKHKVELHIVREDIPTLAKKQRKSLEEAARDFRYEVFDSLVDEYGCSRIALGHHADDRVETILFRVIRGTGRTGLSGMPITRGRIIRPLFETSKAEILTYLKQHRLKFCIDQSNRKSEFTRNYIRNRLIPEIKERLNPQLERALLNLSETLEGEERHLDELAKTAVQRVIRITPGGKIELDTSKFSAYTDWLRRRVLRQCLQMASGRAAADRETIDRLDRFIRSDGKSISLPEQVQAARAGQSVVIHRRMAISYRTVLEPGTGVQLPGLGQVVRCRVSARRAGGVSGKQRSSRVKIDWEKVVPPLIVRPIQTGDRFQPLGLRGTKKVGDYLTDRKVPPVYRDEIPVIADQLGIIWLVGYEIADRVKIGATTRKVAILETAIGKAAKS